MTNDIKKLRKKLEPAKQEGALRHARVKEIYARLSQDRPHCHRNRIIKIMTWSWSDGGCSCLGDFDADMTLMGIEQKEGFIYDD